MEHDGQDNIMSFTFDHIYAYPENQGDNVNDSENVTCKIKKAQDEIVRLTSQLGTAQKEIIDLKELIVINLDLIELQSNEIIQKDKKLTALNEEVDKLRAATHQSDGVNYRLQNINPPPLIHLTPGQSTSTVTILPENSSQVQFANITGIINPIDSHQDLTENFTCYSTVTNADVPFTSIGSLIDTTFLCPDGSFETPQSICLQPVIQPIISPISQPIQMAKVNPEVSQHLRMKQIPKRKMDNKCETKNVAMPIRTKPSTPEISNNKIQKKVTYADPSNSNAYKSIVTYAKRPKKEIICRSRSPTRDVELIGSTRKLIRSPKLNLSEKKELESKHAQAKSSIEQDAFYALKNRCRTEHSYYRKDEGQTNNFEKNYPNLKQRSLSLMCLSELESENSDESADSNHNGDAVWEDVSVPNQIIQYYHRNKKAPCRNQSNNDTSRKTEEENNLPQNRAKNDANNEENEDIEVVHIPEGCQGNKGTNAGIISNDHQAKSNAPKSKLQSNVDFRQLTDSIKRPKTISHLGVIQEEVEEITSTNLKENIIFLKQTPSNVPNCQLKSVPTPQTKTSNIKMHQSNVYAKKPEPPTPEAPAETAPAPAPQTSNSEEVDDAVYDDHTDDGLAKAKKSNCIRTKRRQFRASIKATGKSENTKSVFNHSDTTKETNGEMFDIKNSSFDVFRFYHANKTTAVPCGKKNMKYVKQLESSGDEDSYEKYRVGSKNSTIRKESIIADARNYSYVKKSSNRKRTGSDVPVRAHAENIDCYDFQTSDECDNAGHQATIDHAYSGYPVDNVPAHLKKHSYRKTVISEQTVDEPIASTSKDIVQPTVKPMNKPPRRSRGKSPNVKAEETPLLPYSWSFSGQDYKSLKIDAKYASHTNLFGSYVHMEKMDLTSFEKKSKNKSKLKAKSSLALSHKRIELEVPSWRQKKFDKKRDKMDEYDRELIDDDLRVKRHLKLEFDEKRRKRWDWQHLREQRRVEKLKQSQERRNAISKQARNIKAHEIVPPSFFPSTSDVMAIEVSEECPIIAFGECLPDILQRSFKFSDQVWHSLSHYEFGNETSKSESQCNKPHSYRRKQENVRVENTQEE